MLSHANLWLGAISVADYLGLTPEDRVLAILPLSFDYGQNQLLSTWAAGGCVVPLDYVVPRDVVAAVERDSITTLAGVPSLWRQLVEADWADQTANRLTRITSSGGRLGEPLVRAMRASFPNAQLHSMYGLTEAFRSTSLDPSLIDRMPDSIGSAIPFAEVLVVGRMGARSSPAPPVSWSMPGRCRQGLLERSRTDRRAIQAGAACLALWRLAVWSGDFVKRGRYGQLIFVGRDDEQIKVQGYRSARPRSKRSAIASGAVAEAVAIGVPDPVHDQAIQLVLRPARGLGRGRRRDRRAGASQGRATGLYAAADYRWVDCHADRPQRQGRSHGPARRSGSVKPGGADSVGFSGDWRRAGDRRKPGVGADRASRGDAAVRL